ncbi:MAG: DUF4910 domain-containing protein [Desulfurococcaceae archaeon]
MSKLNQLVEQYKRVPLVGMGRDLLRKITNYHRIQGSMELENAIREINNIFMEKGFETRLFEIPTSIIKGFMEIPASWNVKKGVVEFNAEDGFRKRFDYLDHPTLIAAHSPPGEGCSEVKVCKDVSNCDGEAVILEAPAFVAYKEIDADLIILYDSKRYPEAVPYTGLFIGMNDVKKTSVVNIPYSLALELMSRISRGRKVVACWKIETEFSTSSMHGLLAYKGEDPGVLYVSHICHPKPGAHDNASGVVANVLVSELAENSSNKFPHAHLFIPEYSGTIFADRVLPWVPKAVINLDMVGSKQWITDSTLNIVNTPLFIHSTALPRVYLAIKLVFDEASSFGGFKLPSLRYSISPYTAGSDHDVTVLWGLDSVMLNEWPSKYYHTDRDDIDTISLTQIANTSVASTLAGYLISIEHEKEETEKRFIEYLKAWYSIEALKTGIDTSRLSKVLESRLIPHFSPNVTPVSLRYLYRELGLEKYNKLRNIKGAHSFITVYAPLAHLHGIKDYVEIFQVENLLHWTSEEKQVILEAVDIIKEKLG